MQQLYWNFHKNARLGYGYFQSPARAVVFGLLLFPVCAFSQITVSPASGSGVTNTGNAAVGDVASGKTFSSSVLINATGTSTKNATVPNDAPIQPPQAFVGSFSRILSTAGLGSGLNLANQGITQIDLSLLFGSNGYFDPCDLSGNALSVSAVNAVLAFEVSFSASNGTLDLSGGTNAAPTGQGITDKNTLIANGWTVTVNP